MQEKKFLSQQPYSNRTYPYIYIYTRRIYTYIYEIQSLLHERFSDWFNTNLCTFLGV